MRKLSNARISGLDSYTAMDTASDTKPRRVPGATITAWNGTSDVDLSVYFARPTAPTSVTGSMTQPRTNGTVSLADGTRITFTSPGQFVVVDTV